MPNPNTRARAIAIDVLADALSAPQFPMSRALERSAQIVDALIDAMTPPTTPAPAAGGVHLQLASGAWHIIRMPDTPEFPETQAELATSATADVLSVIEEARRTLEEHVLTNQLFTASHASKYKRESELFARMDEIISTLRPLVEAAAPPAVPTPPQVGGSKA